MDTFIYNFSIVHHSFKKPEPVLKFDLKHEI